MEKSNCELTSVKKMKLDVDDCSKETEEPVVVEEITQDTNFKSPITEPVLTPEIWDQIFCGISGNDFLSVINAAPEWNHLLGSRKTPELFPMLLPHVLPYLEPNEMLACRGVTRDSKEVVDKFLETQRLSDEVLSSDYESSLLPKIDKISDNYKFSSRLEIDGFSSDLSLLTKPPSYNPFLTRALSVDLEDETEDDHIARTEFLTRYGTHFWLLDFTFIERVDNSGIAKLSSYLSLLPNLKTLRLYEEIAGGRKFRISKLPPLEHLRTLDLYGFSADFVTTKFIHSYGTQLSSLVVSGNWIKKIEGSAFKVLLPKLKRLRVENVDATVLEKLSVVDWPLEALNLQLQPGMGDQRQLLLTTISNFKQSLSQLELNLMAYFYRGARNGNFDKEELISIQEKEEKEAVVITESAFKQPTNMEKLVAYWKTAAGNIHKIIIVKTQSDNSVEGNQYKITTVRTQLFAYS